MLSLKELKQIKSTVTEAKASKKKITVDNLLELLESKYTSHNPLTDSYSLKEKQSCVNPTRSQPTIETEQSKFEKKNMVKVRTAGDSMVADETRNAPKVGE